MLMLIIKTYSIKKTYSILQNARKYKMQREDKFIYL